jgi:phosphopantothenoylcysteine decarboxylase / phosphopantothenate---cysteine ligase
MAGNLTGRHVLITAGPTHEYLDDVRYLGNPSTGRMGVELARAARRQGAEVTLVMGPTHLSPEPGFHWIPVVSAADMLGAVRERFDECDVFIAAAAVADYRPAERVEGKIKKGAKQRTLELVRNTDILKTVTKNRRDGQTIVGFSLESRDLLKNGRKKLEAKRCDLMVVNTPGHFGDAREHVIILNRAGIVAELPPLGKNKVAATIIELAAKLQAGEAVPTARKWEGP